jgi:hypothetical protein
VPSTVADIFASAGAKPGGVVRWGQVPARPPRKNASTTGIYVVALTNAVDRVEGTRPKAPIALPALRKLIERRPELRLDDVPNPPAQQLRKRLGQFWFADETVLYIGLAGARRTPHRDGDLPHRVDEYYGTRIGAKSPHAGGWPLRTLACLGELWVHYAYCRNVHDAEDDCIGYFADHVSWEARGRLRDPVRVMPFGNLEFPKGTRKDHGIGGACGPLPKATLTPDEVKLLY